MLLGVMLWWATTASAGAVRTANQQLTLSVGALIPVSRAVTIGPSISLDGQVPLGGAWSLGLSVAGAYLPPINEGLDYAPGNHGLFRFTAGPVVDVPWSWAKLSLGMQLGGGVSNWVVDTWDKFCCGGKRATGFPFRGVLVARLRVGFDAVLLERLVLGGGLSAFGFLSVAWEPQFSPFLEADVRLGFRF